METGCNFEQIQRTRLAEIDRALRQDVALLELAPDDSERQDVRLHIDLMLDERLHVMHNRRFRQ